MNEKEKLITIIQNAVGGCARNWADVIATALIESNEVIVPPCKVGDMVYQTVLIKKSTGFIIERKVVGFHLGDFPKARGEVQRKQYFITYNQDTNSITHIDFKVLGETVFLTKEEAEQALKERK